jgi:hypothetical protein
LINANRYSCKSTFQENRHAKNQLKRWECNHGDKRKWVSLHTWEVSSWNL